MYSLINSLYSSLPKICSTIGAICSNSFPKAFFHNLCHSSQKIALVLGLWRYLCFEILHELKILVFFCKYNLQNLMKNSVVNLSSIEFL